MSGRLPTVHYLVAEVDGTVVGHAAASVVADVAELQRIAVDRAHRRTGLATALLAGVRALAVDGAADRLLLEVREDNAGAIAFYESQGFAEIARRTPLLPRRRHRGRPQPGAGTPRWRRRWLSTAVRAGGAVPYGR